MGARPLVNRFGDAPCGQDNHPARAKGSAIFSEQTWSEIARALDLSGRELEIMRGVFDDQIESAIAGDLGISSHTVHTHLRRLHRKLAVATRTQMALRVMEEFMALTSSPESGLPPLCGKRTAGDCPLKR